MIDSQAKLIAVEEDAVIEVKGAHGFVGVRDRLAVEAVKSR